MFNIPLVVAVVSLAMIGIHVARLGFGRSTDLWVLREFAYVPGRLLAAFDPHAMAATLRAKDLAGVQRSELAEIFLGDGRLKAWTALTYAFLHGSLAHLGLNLVWFVAFGTPVARRFGVSRFLIFFVFVSVVSAAAQTLAQPYGVEPVIGASGAVSGLVAAALRFVFQPGGRLLDVAGSAEDGDSLRSVEALPLIDLWRDRQVVLFVAIWFAMNLLFGFFAQPMGLSDQPIAWQAHIGGFAAGLLSFSLFDPRARKPARDYREASG